MKNDKIESNVQIMENMLAYRRHDWVKGIELKGNKD